MDRSGVIAVCRSNFFALAGAVVVGVCSESASANMLYVANGGDGTVQALNLTTGAATVFASGFSVPRGLAFDAANNLYVVSNGDKTIYKITPAGVKTTFVSGLTGDLYGLAIDSTSGNLFLASQNTANFANSSILEFTPGAAMSTFATINSPGGVAFDDTHTLYVTLATAGPSGEATGGLNKVSTLGVVSPVLATGLADPIGLTRAANGDFFADELAGGMRVMRVTTAGVLSQFATGVGTPYGNALAPDGRLFVADFAGGAIDAVSSGGVVTPFASGLTSPRFITIGPDIAAAPEPGSLVMVSLGGAILLRRRRGR